MALVDPMGIPLIVGASEQVKRNGETFRAHCPRCRENAKMHEAVWHTNVSAFFAISLWDSETSVVQCGECLSVFDEEDSKPLRASSSGSALAPPRARVPELAPPRAPASRRPPIDEAAIDGELAALKKRLGK